MWSNTMFNREDFELPLEAELKQRVILDEIKNCSDIEALRTNLEATVKLVMTYQTLLNTTLKKVVEMKLELQ